MDLTALDFIVVNTATGQAVAAFMLPSDALAFIAGRANVPGPVRRVYEIRNLDGSPISATLEAAVATAA